MAMRRLYRPYQMLDMEQMEDFGLLGPLEDTSFLAPQQPPSLSVAPEPPMPMEVIQQAQAAGFGPYADDGPMTANMGRVAFTPYYEMVGQAEQDMGSDGLLAVPRRAPAPAPVATNPLAEQIRSLYGNRGDWNYGGIDRAAELADLLQKQGVTDVSQIQLLRNTRQEMQGLGGESDGATTLVETPINQVQFGDKRIGFAGDYNNDNTFGSKASEYLQEGNVLGWSARGKGNVKYRVGTDAQGNNYLTPEWNSSSDMEDVRNILKVAAIAAGLHYGLPMLGGETAAAVGAGEAAAGSGLLSSGATLGSAPLSTALATPLAELGTVAGLSEAAVSALPTLAASAPAVLAPSMLSSAPLSTTVAAPAVELAVPSAISGGGMTTGGLLTSAGAPAILSEAAVSALPTLAAPAAPAAAAANEAVQQIITTGSRAAAAPSSLAAAAPAAAATLAAGTAAQDFRPSQNYGEGMTGAQTSAYDGVINATGSPALANTAASTVGAGSTVVDFLKANPTLGRLLFSGAGALLNTVGGPSGGAPGGYVDSGYRPTISRGGFNAAPQARQMAPQPTMGLLNTPTTGQPMSGLWRYGLLGG